MLFHPREAEKQIVESMELLVHAINNNNCC